MKKLLMFIGVFSFLNTSIIAQTTVCNITVTPMDTTICPGDSVFIKAIGSLTGPQSFDFNTGVLPASWSVSGGTNFGQPCGANATATNYYWAATSGVTPQIATPSFDVSCGGYIQFDMKYAIQGQPAPCEGPDQANEGVDVQYSLNGGATWINIIYYSPGGYTLPQNPNTSASAASGPTPYTSWNTYTITLPPGAVSAATKFRWIQTVSSGGGFDAWGLDNVFINAGPCNSAVINWSNGLQDTTSFWTTPTSDTTFIAMVYDTLGNYVCQSDTVKIRLFTPTLTFNLVDQVVADCRLDTTMVQVLNFANAIAPYSTTWSTGSTTNPTKLLPSGLPQDTIIHYVDITDGCGFHYYDSVAYVINQTLAFDTIISSPSSCIPIGYVSAMVIGEIITPAHNVYYTWSGPGANSANSTNASVWTNLGGGWYYIYVEDAVCNISDSIFVEVKDVPVASFEATPTNGCSPLLVEFKNTSQNSTSYSWDFGNGNTLFTASLNEAPNQTYTGTTNVQLVASNGLAACNDTATVTINISYCGCTDPLAINYDPFAVINNGTCIFPEPIISVPNVFSPNGDGSNDVFSMDVLNGLNIELMIFNRWGDLVFSESGINPKWNGKAQSGKDVNDGVYFYKYYVTPYKGDKVEGHGFVHVFHNKK
jgi:gliding motility-associated-like protein